MKTNLNNQDEILFSQYLYQDPIIAWDQAPLKQKEYLLHEFLNIECSVGVFTDQVNSKLIKIHYNNNHEIIINTSSDLAVIDKQLELFLSSL